MRERRMNKQTIKKLKREYLKLIKQTEEKKAEIDEILFKNDDDWLEAELISAEITRAGWPEHKRKYMDGMSKANNEPESDVDPYNNGGSW